jgi:hypothetical protein
MADKPQCKETVYIRDTYRRTGRGKTGFEMHYRSQQCSRRAKDNGYCWQHQRYANKDK